ncbi:MAG: hypothetical protein AB1611_07545 [bacterium]
MIKEKLLTLSHLINNEIEKWTQGFKKRNNRPPECFHFESRGGPGKRNVEKFENRIMLAVITA